MTQRTKPEPCTCQLCAYLLHGGPVGNYPPCRDNEACATAANAGRPCPCKATR